VAAHVPLNAINQGGEFIFAPATRRVRRAGREAAANRSRHANLTGDTLKILQWRDALVVRVFPIRRPRVAITKSPVRAIATGNHMQSVPRRIASRILPRALLCVTEFLRTTMCLARIACTLWQSAFAPTMAAAARSVTEMRLGKFTWPIVGSITGALTGVMTFTAALCLVASDIRALMASAGGGRRNDFHEARVWQRGVRTGH